MTTSVDTIISVEWLKNNLNDPTSNICLLDASWHLPSFGRDAIQEFKDGHIAGAQFFNISPYNCGLPSVEQFTKDVASLCVTSDTHVVIYDSNATFGLFSAPRAWWLWKSYGHPKVSILNGGIPAWKEAAGELTTDVITPDNGKASDGQSFQFKFTPSSCTKTRAEIEANVVNKTHVFIDTRSPGRFAGIDPEPRPDIKSGHIVNSINIPFSACMTSDKLLKNPEQLRKMFTDNSVDFTKPTIASCGSGVSACFMVLAGHLVNENVSLYDGAWIDFFQNGAEDLKVVSKA